MRVDSPCNPCRSITSTDGTAVLTVIVPVYNEASTVSELLSRVLAADYSKQVIVVDDGSSDATGDVLAQWEERSEIVVVRHEANRGKGAAIRTGLERAHGQFVIVQDADLEYDPGEYSRLIEPLRNVEADVVYGSRRLGHGCSWREWLNPFHHGVTTLNFLVWLWYGVRLSDEATCYKAMATDVLRRMHLECERFEFCPEVTAKACRMGLRITEVPIAYHRRALSEGKKIRLHDWFEAAATLRKWRRWLPEPEEKMEQSGQATNRTNVVSR